MDRILVIDDEAYNLDSVNMILSDEGFSVDMADNANKGLALLKDNEYSCVLLDLKMPGMDGFHTLPLIKEQRPMLPVIILSAFGHENTAKVVIELGAFDFINKPPDMNNLILKVKNAIEIYKSKKNIKELKQKLIDSFFLKSDNPVMQNLYQQAKKVAPMNIPVLITGESGTGKDVLARYIHQYSNRHDKPYIAINCSALPFNLIESELFGYEKGAFTGADKTYMGLLMSAQDGTLFLDEIGDMPVETQAKLLRVLETGEFHRIGSSASYRTNARIIAATNKDISEQISKNMFREDLYYRLNVISLHIPPLRERKEDIEAFSQFFIDEFCQKNNIAKKILSKASIEYFRSFRFNGNIRELRNLCIKLAILSESKIIEKKDFDAIVFNKDSGGFQGILYLPTLKRFKAEAEKLFLIRKLKENNYNISKTAEAIDTPRSNLYKKIEAYEIEVKN